MARQDTVTLLVTQIRRVRKLIPQLQRVWVREHNLEPGRPPCDWDDPADIDRLVSKLVDDANGLVWAAADLELNQVQADAVALLALVAGQDVEPGDGPGQWPGSERARRWLAGFGAVVAIGFEPSGAYGAALTRHLRDHDLRAIEVNQVQRAVRMETTANDPYDFGIGRRLPPRQLARAVRTCT